MPKVFRNIITTVMDRYGDVSAPALDSAEIPYERTVVNHAHASR